MWVDVTLTCKAMHRIMLLLMFSNSSASGETMTAIAKFSVSQYERMIDAGVFVPKEKHPWELIRGEIRNWETTANFSISEYDRILAAGIFDFPEKQRVELIRGELRMMSPINPPHESALDRLLCWSFDHAPRDQVLIRNQNSLGLLTLESVPQPDLFWVEKKDYSQQRPTSAEVFLIIEVAGTSLKYDLGEKAELYARENLADYWIVNVINRVVEVFREPENGRYQSMRTYKIGEMISPLAFPEIALTVADLWAK